VSNRGKQESAAGEATPAGGSFMHRFDRIWWKLLVTYLLVAAICLTVVIVIVYEVSASSYNRHVEVMTGNGMNSMMSGLPGLMMGDLNSAFRQAVNDSIVWGGAIAIIVAVLLSLIISRRITRPVHDMAAATELIAAGDYGQRVSVSGHDEIGSLGHSLNGMAMRLQEGQQLRRELMANIAHELRTPLTSISGYMEGLEDGVVPATPETYATVRREALRLSRLVEDLQRLSRAESGQEELDVIAIDPAFFLKRVTTKMGRQFQEKGVSLAAETVAGTPALLADEDKLEQIMINLLDNALRYTDAGGRVHVGGNVQNGKVAIEIADTGQGIAAEDLPYIFERFFRTDKSRARASGGTGIGLTIVKRYVEALGGSISVVSEAGAGTTFTVLLPAAS